MPFKFQFILALLYALPILSKKTQKIKYTTPNIHKCVLNIDKYMWACRLSVTKYQFFACRGKNNAMKLTPQYAIKTDGK